MSSQCAPRHSTRSARPLLRLVRSREIMSVSSIVSLRLLGVALPDHPRAITLSLHAIERNLVLERFHRVPEAAITIRCQQAFFDEPCEWLDDELLAFSNVVEDLGAQREETAVQPDRIFVERAQPRDEAVVRRTHRVERVLAVD